MQEKQHINNEPDNFSWLVKNKLEDHQLQVDEGCWQEIEARLNGKKHKRIPLWTWISGTVATAAAVILLFVVPSYTDAVRQVDVAEQIDQFTDSPTEQMHKAGNEAEIEHYAKNYEDKNQPRNPERESYENGIIVAKQNIAEKNRPESITKAETLIIDRTEEKLIAEIQSDNGMEGNTETEKIEKVKENNTSGFNPYDRPNADWQSKKKKKQNNWLVAASVNTGGRALSNEQEMTPLFYEKSNDYLESPDGMYEEPSSNTAEETESPGAGNNLPEQGINIGNDYLNTLERHNFSSVTHLPPLSFGVRVRKDFNKHFALESGLTYTYLSSKFADAQPLKREATLNMHYLGIPVNAVVYLANNPKWNVYFLAGGMMEKGLWSTYKERNYYSETAHRDVLNSDHIKGLQWSVNASFGIAYSFYRDFSIYFEPNIAYYLNNNQPLSVRTESPLIVGLNAGIRYRIK